MTPILGFIIGFQGTTTYNTILHTLQSATVLDYVLENKKSELEDAQERTPFFNSQSQLFSESNFVGE